MPFNREKRSKEAQFRPRDKDGHFIPLKPSSRQVNLLADLINPNAEKDISIREPFKKLIGILEDFKNKQSIASVLKQTILFVALPIAILFAFQLGKLQTQCQTHFSTQIGTLQNITVVRTVGPDNWLLKSLSYLPFLSDIYNKKVSLKESVVVNPQDETIVIKNEANANLNAFNQSKVIVFGDYDSCSRSLILDSAQNISNY